MNTKRFCIAMLGLCLWAGLGWLPGTAKAAPATTVRIAGQALTNSTPYYHNGTSTQFAKVDNNPTGANAYFNKRANTLTLDGLDISTDQSIIVEIDGDILLLLNGTSSATSMYIDDDDSYGLKCAGSLTVQGSGSLTVTGGTSKNNSSYGIFSIGSITVTGGSLTATGGTSRNFSSYGVYALSSVTANGGTLEGIGGYGIGTENTGPITFSGGSTVQAKGSTKALPRAAKLDPLSLARASDHYNGTPIQPYYPNDNDNYKWFKLEPYATSVKIGTAVLNSDTPYYHNGVNGAQGVADAVAANAHATLVPGTDTARVRSR